MDEGWMDGWMDAYEWMWMDRARVTPLDLKKKI
jgi:hypothetical protein